MALCAGPAMHVMLYGGSRSGKTFLLLRNIVMRALKAPNSRHAVFRFRYNHLKASVILDTWPKMMQLCYPGLVAEMRIADGYAELPNGSQVWFAGLDDQARTEKILGMEFATEYFNEASQIPQSSVDMALTRLAQRAETQMANREPGVLRMRCYYDCNPPSKAHWIYKRFVQGVDPDTRRPLAKPEQYAHYQINPDDNTANLSAEYLDTLGSMSARMQRRFRRGEFEDATPNQLFKQEDIDKWRVLDGSTPDMVRIVVAVDPSGAGDSNNADNDAIGIVVAGLGTDGNAYVLEDCTVKAGPATWAGVAVSAYERHAADCIVGEINYGGAMVEATIQAAARSSGQRRAPYKAVTATRGKVVRAEPIAALYEQGKVRHVGYFGPLEDELSAFSTAGYVGDDSPNRADALVWALTELFPGVVAGAFEAVRINYPHRRVA